MTRDELNPKWRAKYDALMDEWMSELDKIPVPEKRGFILDGGTSKPRRELEKKYFPRLDALMEAAEKDMKASEKENM